MPPFEIEIQQSGTQAVIAVTGEIDISTSPHLLAASADSSRVVVDLRRATFMDSSGLHALRHHDRAARSRGGQLEIVRGPTQVQRVFTLTRTTDTFVFRDDVPETA